MSETKEKRKYRYAIERGYAVELIQQIDRLASDGWELVCVVGEPDKSEHVAYLRNGNTEEGASV